MTRGRAKKLAPVPPSAEGIYRTWLAMVPESRQHATIDFFYAFTRAVLHATRLGRDGQWLAERLKVDSPELSEEAIAWYAERFDIVLEYERSVWKHSQPLRVYGQGLFEEQAEALRTGMIQPGERLTEAQRRVIRQRRREEREAAGGGQIEGQRP